MAKPFKSFSRKIKVFLHRNKWKETLIFLAFALLSFGFWYLQSLQQDYEIEKSIPIKYKNIPPEIAFTDSLVEKIHIRLRDKGSVLLNYSFGRSFPPIEVNMKDIPLNKETLTIDRKNIEADIYKQLLATTTLISFEPDEIEVKYNKRKEKNVPVVFSGSITPTTGFHQSGEVEISPSFISIYAAKSVLDTIKEVKTVYTEIKKVNKTTTRSVALENIKSVTYEQENVSVTVPIEEFTEKTLEIPIVLKNIPENYTARLFPPTIKVIASIPVSYFKGLSADQFSIEIPFDALTKNTTGIIPLKLNKQPSWVRSVTLSPDKIEFILEQQKEND